MPVEMAIEVRGLSRGYKKVGVLKDLEMNLPKGMIYGLLGPSGCGKTTLLNVLLGRLIPWEGEVSVLGNPPGEKGSAIPGSLVGYAPQELALYLDLSIHETFLFNSRLHRMESEKFKEREAWLKDFLELPDLSRVVGGLSGGEKRRVSVAVALLHEPRLLLLDEPTVGVDPELRSRIWHHLRRLALDGVTIVITTHYIEEARQADIVGMMREGVMLAEDDPDVLMTLHGLDTLESVFLDLCRRESGEEEFAESTTAIPPITNDEPIDSPNLDKVEDEDIIEVVDEHIEEVPV